MNTLRFGVVVAISCVAACAAASRASDPYSGSDDAGVPSADAADAPFDGWSTQGDAGVVVEAGVDGGELLPPAVACAPSGSLCGAAPIAATRASYRKDAFLPSSAYSEQGSEPTSGGRVQVAAIAAVDGDVTDVVINGTSAETLVTQQPKLEWYQVWPRHLIAGQPVWIAFHSQDTAWDAASSFTLAVKTAAGDAVSTTVALAKAAVPITYATTVDDGATLVVHVHNDDTRPHTLSRLLVDGVDATRAACIASPTIAPGEAAMWTVPLCTKAARGAAWTIVAEWSDATPSVGAGRVLPERFITESWVSSGDCAFPGANATTYAAHQAAGFDTHFLYWGGSSSCGFTGSDIVNVRAPQEQDFNVLVADDFLSRSNPGTLITNASRVTGFLIGDEVDGTVWSNGASGPSARAASARTLWTLYPEIPVYQGAKTNKNVGAYAGATDVQGEDFYVAACAPHITQWGTHPPLRAAFDYLRNTRNNQMPLPTWLYAQGLSAGWDKKQPVTDLPIRIQPEPQEIIVQAMSALAAGAKGLMWFQTTQSDAAALPASWDAIGRANWATRGVRALLREGDPTGHARATGEAIADAIRARDGIVVPIISLATSVAPTDTACAQAQVGLGAIPHWQLAAQSIDVTVDVPSDLGIVDVFEIDLAATKVAAPASPPKVAGRAISFSGLPFDQSTPARLLVLARTKTLRGEVAAALHR